MQSQSYSLWLVFEEILNPEEGELWNSQVKQIVDQGVRNDELRAELNEKHSDISLPVLQVAPCSVKDSGDGILSLPVCSESKVGVKEGRKAGFEVV